MAKQTWLADVLRSAGLTVHEESGWKTRDVNDGTSFSPQGIIIHETRGSVNSTDAGEIKVLVNGRAGLSGPIAQLYLSRSGEWWVIAAGKCHHVKKGWAGPFKGLGNTNLLGIEAQHADKEPWTSVQYQSYVRGVAAIQDHTGWRIAGHKEHQPYPPPPGETSTKTDPLFNMDKFRQDVADYQSGGFLVALSDKQQQETYDRIKQLAWSVGRGVPIPDDPSTFEALTWALDRQSKLLQAVATRVDLDQAEIDRIVLAVPSAEENAEAVMARLAGSSDEDVVAALRAALGDRAASIGRMLADS